MTIESVIFKLALTEQFLSLGSYFGNQIITGWLIAGTHLLKTLSDHSLRVKKNLQYSHFKVHYSHFKMCIAVNFKSLQKKICPKL